MFQNKKRMKFRFDEDSMQNVTVRVSKNRSHRLRIFESDSVLDMKQKIEELEEIPVLQQRILHMGTELLDSYICSSIFEEDEGTDKDEETDEDEEPYEDEEQKKKIFICESKQLLVILPESRVITVPIEAGDKLHIVKKKLEKSTGIPQKDQRIFFSCCSFKGKQLDDSKTVFENDVDDNRVYMLRSKPGMQIFIEILETNRKIMNFSIDNNSSIIEIKRQVQNNFLNNIMDYKLFYQDDELDGTKNLAFYNIANNSTLQLCSDKIIYVKRVSGEKLKFKVELSTTISQLKSSIARDLNLPSDNIINLSSHGVELCNGSHTLYEYHIGYGMTVKIETGVIYKIFSKFRSMMNFELPLSAKILHLKEQIKLKTGIPIDYQFIFNENGSELIDTSSADKHSRQHSENYKKQPFSIRLEASLLVKSRADLILRVVVDNTSHIVEVMHTDTVLTLKKAVLQQLDRPLKYICYYETTCLTDNLTLANIDGLCNMSCIQIFRKCQGFPIFIAAYSGTYTCMVSSSTPIEEIKLKMQHLEGIPAYHQTLICDGKRLGGTLSDCNIIRGDTLELYMMQTGC